jgi:hypothetical protein
MTRENWLPQVRANLTWLDRNYQTVQDHLAPGASIKSDVHTKPGSRPPLNITALSLTQRGGIAGQLNEWAQLAVERRGLTPPNPYLADEPFFHAVIVILQANLDWFSQMPRDPGPPVYDPWADMRREVFTLRRDVELTCGLVNESPIPGDRKLCPLDRTLDNGTTVPCNGRLIQDHDRDVIYCRTCKTPWDKTQWLHLGRLLREMETTA